MPPDPGRTTRQIDAPAADWLTPAECVLYLRLNEAVWDRLVAAGWVPGLRALSRQCVLVPWQSVVAVQWRLLTGEVPPEEAAETRPKSRKVGETGE